MKPVQLFAALAAWLCLSTAAAAQAAPPKPLTPGEIFIDRNGDTLQVLACRGAGWQAECQVRRLAESGNAPIDPSAPRWWTVDVLRGSAENWIYNGGKPYAGPPVPLPGAAPAQAAARPAPARGAAPAARTAAAPQAARVAAGGQTGACPRTPYGGPVSGSTPASEALFKRKVADSYTMQAYGPYWYGVTFNSFKVGAPIRNTVSKGPGGATRVTNGAPVNATLYPVDSSHTVCEGAPSASERRNVTIRYFCFVSANNEWTCGAR